jgi:hypothetical protein
MPTRVRGEMLWGERTTPLHRATSAAKEEGLRGSGSTASGMQTVIRHRKRMPRHRVAEYKMETLGCLFQII